MTTKMEGVLLIGVLVVASFFFQLQLKVFANEIGPILSRSDLNLWGKLVAFAQSLIAWRPVLIAALGASVMGIWLLALMKLDLSLALPLASLTIVVNAVLGGMWLGEAISGTRMAGILTVAAGIMLVLRS